jgi:hypothetical protein
VSDGREALPFTQLDRGSGTNRALFGAADTLSNK